jgi:hypothetical protein
MIIRNAIRCHACDHEIESKHEYDLVWCKCFLDAPTKCAVNGGNVRLVRVGSGHWDELAEISDEKGI